MINFSCVCTYLENYDRMKLNDVIHGGFLLSKRIVDITPILFPTSESAFATERHQLVGRICVLHVRVVRVIKHVTRLLPRKIKKLMQFRDKVDPVDVINVGEPCFKKNRFSQFSDTSLRKISRLSQWYLDFVWSFKFR